MSLPNNTLPNADPAIQSGPTPYFIDNTFVRGDHMRANNQRIWANEAALLANDQFLDTQMLADEAAIAANAASIASIWSDLTLEYVRFGVSSINAFATLYQQFGTITSFVGSRNKNSTPFAQANELTLVTAGTSSVSVTSAGISPALCLLPNGKLLIVVYASTTTYNLYLYDFDTNSSVAAGTATLSVTASGSGISACLLPNGKVLIIVKASTTAYNLYLYDPVANTAVAAGTANLTVTATGWGTGLCLLPNGKVLIVVYASTTTYNLYLYDPVGNSAVAAGTATLTVTASGTGANAASLPGLCLLPNGKVLIVVYASTTTYKLYLYDPVGNSAVAAGTATLTVTATNAGPSVCLLPNGKVLIVVYASTTTYNLYLYDPVGNSAVASSGSPVTPGGTLILYACPSIRLMPSGKVLMLLPGSTGSTSNFYIYDPVGDSSALGGNSSTTVSMTNGQGAMVNLPKNIIFVISMSGSSTYNFYFANGPWGTSNRYQFPSELLESGMI